MKLLICIFLYEAEAENQEEDHEVDNQKSGALWESHVAAVPGTTGRGKHLSVRSFFQWVTGHAHVPLIESVRDAFQITVNFEHDCESQYGAHRHCYPIVNACAVGITFPIRHLGTYHDFEDSLTTAIRFGYEFSRH